MKNLKETLFSRFCHVSAYPRDFRFFVLSSFYGLYLDQSSVAPLTVQARTLKTNAPIWTLLCLLCAISTALLNKAGLYFVL